MALKLGEAGLRVLGIEERLVGGECPYYGCVPSKMMIAAAHTLREAGRVNTMAGSSTVTPDWTPVADRIRDEATDDWDDTVAVKRLEDSGATFVRGRGVLAGDGRVRVGRHDVHRDEGDRGQHRYGARRAARRRARGHAVLDQPGRRAAA